MGVDTAEKEPLEVWGKIQFIIHSFNIKADWAAHGDVQDSVHDGGNGHVKGEKRRAKSNRTREKQAAEAESSHNAAGKSSDNAAGKSSDKAEVESNDKMDGEVDLTAKLKQKGKRGKKKARQPVATSDAGLQ